jgi:hypothetical protein
LCCDEDRYRPSAILALSCRWVKLWICGHPFYLEEVV